MRRLILILVLVSLTGCGMMSGRITEWACERCNREKVCYVKPYLDILPPPPLTLHDVPVKVYQVEDDVGIWMSKDSFN